eukprot:4831100-Pleurochrysis_carterae.AAC.3
MAKYVPTVSQRARRAGGCMGSWRQNHIIRQCATPATAGSGSAAAAETAASGVQSRPRVECSLL